MTNNDSLIQTLSILQMLQSLTERELGRDTPALKGDCLRVRAEEPRPAPSLEMALMRQDQAISELHELIGRLEELLGPILEPEAPSGCGENACGMSGPMLSAAVSHATANSEAINNATRRLAGVLSRVQLSSRSTK